MHNARAKSGLRNPAYEALSLLAMTLISSAVGAGLYMEARFSVWLSVCVALLLHSVLVGLHLLIRRLHDRPEPGAESRVAEPARDGSPDSASGTVPQARASAQKNAPSARKQPSPSSSKPGLPSARAAPEPLPARLSGSPLSQPVARPRTPDDAQNQPVQKSAAQAAADAVARTATATRAANPSGFGDAGAAASVGDLWSYRPASPALKRPAPATFLNDDPPPSPAQRSAEAGRETSVEMVQGAVRQLADRVNGTAGNPASNSAGSSAKIDGAIEASLEALRTTAETMRAVSRPQNMTGNDRVSSKDPENRNAVEAIAAGRCDVSLEPIVHLEDRRQRHYRAFLKLKAPNGEPITIEAGGTIAGLDSLWLARASQLARRLAERGKQGFVFFDLSGGALRSDLFLAEFAALCQEPAAWVRQLVPTFTSADVARFEPRDWDAVRNIGSAGLCFALQGLDHANIKLEGLKPWGIEFVDVPARALLAGLPSASGPVSPAEFARTVAAAGLTLTISGILDEASLAPITASAGTALGRGPILGLPRPVKADLLVQSGQHAA